MHSLTYASNGRWSQYHNMSLSVHMHVDDSYLLSTISHAQRWSQSCAIQLPIFHIVGYAVLCHDARCAARWRPVPPCWRIPGCIVHVLAKQCVC